MRHARQRTPSDLAASAAQVTSRVAEDPAAFWSREAATLLAELRSEKQGLSSIEATRRLRTEGFNTLDEKLDTGTLRLALSQFNSSIVAGCKIGQGGIIRARHLGAHSRCGLLKRGDRGRVELAHPGHQCLLSCIARALRAPQCRFLRSAPLLAVKAALIRTLCHPPLVRRRRP